MDSGANHPAQHVPTFVPRLAATAKSQPFEVPNSVLSHTSAYAEAARPSVALVVKTGPGEETLRRS
jgi:hypothetical protein